MARSFQDTNFLVWEAFPSGGDFGLSTHPHVVFHCLTDRGLRPRFVEFEGDGSDAEKAIAEASAAELLRLLEQSREAP